MARSGIHKTSVRSLLDGPESIYGSKKNYLTKIKSPSMMEVMRRMISYCLGIEERL